MTFSVIGKISMRDTTCGKCNEKIALWGVENNIKCKSCGATYELQSEDLNGDQVEYIYDFTGFRCMYSKAIEKCDEMCPAPEMYCKEHVDDRYLDEARGCIKYSEKQLEKLKETLDSMEESKKTWLIQEVAGLNE